ncbi:TPA: hypothetical protein N0F65_012822 [Lagenidium giganteum]|uniref:DNA-(apurinic or apyrimidinic site) endonuclease n=1 Tax=Lagenidium giganteum TaxID=4803 RepID=A0AAV2YGJ1_9STRA|nr:TPA: hypothetical protein N0F65_012822 [Lagenidium giganteum]
MNVYCPAVRNSERLEYKLAFHEILRDRIRALQECGKRIILVGDINIAHKEIDHCEPQPSDDGTAFGDHPCRLWMNKLVCNVRTPSLGCLVDSFRHFHPTQEKAFTCWNTVTSARETNYGTRIDYILIDPALMEDFVMDVSHEPGRLGSDHCPVVCAMKLRIAASDDDVKINKAAALCSKYYAEFAGKQQNIKSFLRRDLCSVRAPSTNDAIKTTLSGSRKRGTSSSGQKSIKSFFSSSGLSSSRASSHPTNEGHQKSSFDFELAWAIKASLKRQRTHDQDQQLQWKQVLTGQPPPTPLCHCNQPTVLRAVLKHNDNWGRKFYVCTKPAGPKGDPNARCEYFQWADQRGKKKDTITYQPPDATSNNGQ